MSDISGFENEEKIIEYLNNKQIKALNQNMKNFITFLFGNIDDKSVIHAITGKKRSKA